MAWHGNRDMGIKREIGILLDKVEDHNKLHNINEQGNNKT